MIARHYYATMALTYERMSIYTLAKHMGTSVLMIEQHYGHLRATVALPALAALVV